MNKGLYENAIRVIDILLEKGILSDKEGRQFFGEAEWETLRQWFKVYGKHAVFITLQALNKQGTSETKALRLHCEQAIEQINREEADRNLRNEESRANIDGVKHAKITAWVAIVVSIVSLIVSLLSVTIWK